MDDTDGNVQAAILMAFLISYFRYVNADFHSHCYQQPKSQTLKQFEYLLSTKDNFKAILLLPS